MKYLKILAILLIMAPAFAGGNPDVALPPKPYTSDTTMSWMVGAGFIIVFLAFVIVIVKRNSNKSALAIHNESANRHLEGQENANLTVSEKRLQEIRARATQLPSEIKKPL